MAILTREILEAGKSQMGGYSNAQFRLLGIDPTPPPGFHNKMIPKGWKKMVVGHDFPREVLDEFVALKDKHLTPKLIERQLKARAKREAALLIKRTARQIEAAAAKAKATPVPDGLYDNRKTMCREGYENGEVILWKLSRNVEDWGAYPDVP